MRGYLEVLLISPSDWCAFQGQAERQTDRARQTDSPHAEIAVCVCVCVCVCVFVWGVQDRVVAGKVWEGPERSSGVLDRYLTGT